MHGLNADSYPVYQGTCSAELIFDSIERGGRLAQLTGNTYTNKLDGITVTL